MEAGCLALTALIAVVVGLTSTAVQTFAAGESALHPAAWATLLTIVGAVGLLWILLPVPGRTQERLVAAALTPAALLGAAAGFSRAANAWGDVVVAGVVILLAAFGASALARATTRRPAWDVVTALGALALLPAALATAHAWLPLLLLAVAALVAASGNGPVLTGSAPRRHLAWVALPLSTAALWIALVQRSVTLVEAYTLPLAGVLLLLAAALTLWREPAVTSAPDDDRGLPLDGRTALFAAALATGILPSLVVSGGGPVVRPLLLVLAGSLAAALVVAGPAVRALATRGPAVRLPLIVSALVAVGGTSVVRGVTAGLDGAGRSAAAPWTADAWAAGGAVILLAAALAWRRDAAGGPASPRTGTSVWAAPVAVLGAIVTLTVPELVLVPAHPGEAIRPVVVAAVLAGGSVLAAGRAPAQAAGLLRFVALGASAFVVFDALVAGVAHRVAFEALTAPLAAALVAAGALDLRRDASRRSWPALGAGLLLGLLPSLAADYLDVTVLRVVLLGAAALAVLLVGVRAHLQAPVVIGGAVVILHALAQVWPGLQVLSTSVPWWLWAGVGGVLLIVVAATYERRIQQARAVTRTLASLR
ncbi:hypothetical protein GCM10025867_05970 [Frondihabitans sucicola]|uniref:Uncharacterized protein n=1 Tax=Frondihabitans sucicola TaxID=1268041 RepID=A0ABN6XTQ6_9MICO|nr:hypothetical protein [Frondihabitans sucicola]BDZ48356.1 hypothetical protein GCM10025867_05970 [Frondihabitans sucicola]